MKTGGFMLLAGAVGAAATGQALTSTRPWLSCACFGVAMALFLIGERSLPSEQEASLCPASKLPLLLWGWLAAGCLACLASAIAVYRYASPSVTHGLWFLGLGLFVGCALWLWWRGRPRLVAPAGRTVAAWLVLLALCGALFAWNLTTMPPEVHGDDAEVGNDAFRILEGEPLNLFRTSWFMLPLFHAVPTAIGLEIFGGDLAGLRGTSVVLGTASVLLLFAVVRRLWGFEAALLSGLLLVSGRYFIHLSRAGFHYIDTPFLSLLVIWLFLRVWHDQRPGAAVWCGIALGLGVQTYYASRLVPILLALTWLVWTVRGGWARLATRVGHFAIIVMVALATAAPMAGEFAHDWDALWARTRDTSIFNPAAQRHLSHGYGTDDFGEILMIQMRAAATVFNASGDSSEQYGYDEPMFDPVTAALFVLGLAGLCARPMQGRSSLVLLWLIVPVVVGGALTIDTPFYPRFSGAVPFAILAAAVALQRLLGSLRTLVPGKAGSWLSGALATATLMAVLGINVQTYFVDYAPRRHLSPGPQIGAWVRAHGAGKTTYMVGGAPGFFIKHGTIRFLTHGYETRDIADLEHYLRTRKLDPATSLFIIMPKGESLVPRLEEAVGPLNLETFYHPNGNVDFWAATPLGGVPEGEGAVESR